MFNRYMYAAFGHAAAGLVRTASAVTKSSATVVSRDARHRRSRRQRRTRLPDHRIVQDRRRSSFKQLDISGEFSKRITEDFAVSFAPTWTHLYAPGGPTMTGASGFQNMETTFKYRLFKNAEHEFVMSAGLDIEWGGSGAQDVGAERFNVYTPTLYFGKGFGDLPDEPGLGAAVRDHRPGRLRDPGRRRRRSASIPTPATVDTEFNPRVLDWGATLQYSMPYLKSAVVDLGLPDFVNHLIPIVEASLQTPVSNTLHVRHCDHRHHQSGLDLGRQILPDRRRSDDPDQPPKRHQRRRHRATALLPRRHLPHSHRAADFRQWHRLREAEVRQLDHAQHHTYRPRSRPCPVRRAAHAFLDHAEPRVGSTAPSAPRKWFSGSHKSLSPPSARLRCAMKTGCGARR